MKDYLVQGLRKELSSILKYKYIWKFDQYEFSFQEQAGAIFQINMQTWSCVVDSGLIRALTPMKSEIKQSKNIFLKSSQEPCGPKFYTPVKDRMYYSMASSVCLSGHCRQNAGWTVTPGSYNLINWLWWREEDAFGFQGCSISYRKTL